MLLKGVVAFAGYKAPKVCFGVILNAERNLSAKGAHQQLDRPDPELKWAALTINTLS